MVRATTQGIVGEKVQGSKFLEVMRIALFSFLMVTFPSKITLASFDLGEEDYLNGSHISSSLSFDSNDWWDNESYLRALAAESDFSCLWQAAEEIEESTQNQGDQNLKTSAIKQEEDQGPLPFPIVQTLSPAPIERAKRERETYSFSSESEEKKDEQQTIQDSDESSPQKKMRVPMTEGSSRESESVVRMMSIVRTVSLKEAIYNPQYRDHLIGEVVDDRTVEMTLSETLQLINGMVNEHSKKDVGQTIGFTLSTGRISSVRIYHKKNPD